MPGMVLFGRRWAIASDDLFFPGLFELFLRVLWWLGILALYLRYRGKLECARGVLLSNYMVVLMVLLAVIICTMLAIVYVSTRGKKEQAAWLAGAVGWSAVLYSERLPSSFWTGSGAGADCNHGFRCEAANIAAELKTVYISNVYIVYTFFNIILDFKSVGDQLQVGTAEARASDSLERFQHRTKGRSSGGLKTAATSVWEKRVKLLCCCVEQDDQARMAFSSTAELFSTYFSDTDLVPSDLVAGLTLLHQQQDRVRKNQAPKEVISHSPGSSQEDGLDAELENCRHYMPFAAAAYGWPLYVYSNPFTGLCRLGGDCCRSRTTEYDVVGGDQLHCHSGSVLRVTGLQHRDFIHMSFHDKVYELPFLVVLDHKKECVVVAVRGTLSLQDILTDLSAETENLDLGCEVQDCSAHKGMSQAAKYLYRRLVSDGILSQAFSVAPEYRLVIVGHSLGAGAAVLLAMMLRGTYPHVRCYAFSPPRGLLSKSLYEYSKDFTVSLVLGKDVVPRLSVTTMEDLKKKILRLIANCNKPKYKILLRGCWYGLFGGNTDDLPTELDGGDHRDLTLPLLGEQSLLTHKSPGYRSNDSPLESPTKYPPLYLPGRIIHLEEEGTSGRCSCYSAQYSARWSHESEFSEILIGGKMLTDHLPDILTKALDRVVSNREACISCPTPGGSA
ncbi:hypothetical protein QTO34_016373 [Cnephaeus nilssonii]|uniref:Diacylglycerol lipase-beta n=1 Tax=Cnephaeus nilssonii TaxID=3371016 RepID=A0AA40I5U1_CNENI|nr:hypothetical protein QTO34_016373 [Eptesicus nilssonii]